MHQRSNLFWPVNIIVGFIIVVGLMLASAAITPLNVLAIDPLFCPTNGPAVGYPAYPECTATRAALQTGTALAQNPATNTPTTDNNSGNNNTNPAPTNTPTATLTATNEGEATDSTTTPTSTATPTVEAAPTASDPAEPSITPTPQLPPGVEARVCLPGATIEISGEGIPGTALIVTFSDRPVGGGSVRSDGTYRITLRIGPERPGLYLVEVEERDSRFVIQEFGCEVPAPDSSPTPDPGNG